MTPFFKLRHYRNCVNHQCNHLECILIVGIAIRSFFDCDALSHVLQNARMLLKSPDSVVIVLTVGWQLKIEKVIFSFLNPFLAFPKLIETR